MTTRLSILASIWVAVLFGALASPASATPQASALLSHTRTQCGGSICVTVTLDGILGHNVTKMSVVRRPGRYGHFEFFGPAGHISDSVTKTWNGGETYSYSRFMTGNKGALWCARFWAYYPVSGSYNDSGNICVTG